MALKEFFESAEQEYYHLLEELLVVSGELHIVFSAKVKLFVIIFSENSNLYDSGNSLPAIPASLLLP